MNSFEFGGLWEAVPFDYATLTISLIWMLCSAGYTPTFGHLAVPTGNPATPDSWRPARPGAGIRLTTVAGVRYEGTIAALGDSLDIIVITGPGRSSPVFSWPIV